jgi:hypothetical protein
VKREAWSVKRITRHASRSTTLRRILNGLEGLIQALGLAVHVAHKQVEAQDVEVVVLVLGILFDVAQEGVVELAGSVLVEQRHEILALHRQHRFFFLKAGEIVEELAQLRPGRKVRVNRADVARGDVAPGAEPETRPVVRIDGSARRGPAEVANEPQAGENPG